ncbi:MAG: MFS transporter [Deltaproteobacteria bacterium]|nr:MFS transporter [Deltaproteobacteria bacterium]
MPTLADSRPLRLLTLSLLYLAQGIPWGFIAVGYVVLLADSGLDAAAIGAAVGLAYLPWSFKILWGPLLDAVPQLRIGRRRPFIVFAELFMGITLVGLMLIDPKTSLPAVAAMLFLHNTFAAMQDVAVDALAVDLLTDDERGRANSFMWAGKSLGVVIGGGGGTVFAKHYGWSALFIVMAIAIWAIMLLPLVFRERPARPDDVPVHPRLLRLSWFLLPFAIVGAVMYGLSELESRYAEHPLAPLIPIAQPFFAVFGAIAAWPLVDREGFARLRASFSFPTPWWGVVAGILTPAGYAMIGPAMSRMTRVDLALSEERIAFLSGTVDPVAGVIGALLGGIVADRLGARRAIGFLMVLLSGTLAVWAAADDLWPSWPFLVTWTFAFQLFVNAYSAATLGLFMSLSNPRIGATHFAVYMAATNLTYAWTAPFGGEISDRYGIAVLFGVAAAIQVVTIGILPFLDAARARREYGEAVS